MTVVVAILVVAVVMLLLMFLGTLREVAVLQSRVTSFRQLILRPARPGYVPGAIPQDFSEELRRRAVHEQAAGRPVVAVFVRPDCEACHGLLRDLTLLGPDALSTLHLVIIIGNGRGLATTRKRLASSAAVIEDINELIFDAAGVRTTPTVIALDSECETATEYTEGGTIAWLLALAEHSSQELAVN